MQTEQATIADMNGTIAEFMGLERYEDSSGIWFKREGQIKCMHTKLQDLGYHTSWNELMPVVEKISKMPLLKVDNSPCTHPQDVCYPRTFGMPTEDGKQVMFRFNGFSLHIADRLIDAVYRAVYEVIQHNNLTTIKDAGTVQSKSDTRK